MGMHSKAGISCMHSMRFRCGFTFLAPGPFPYDTMPQKDKLLQYRRVWWGGLASLSGLTCSGSGDAQCGEESCPQMGRAETSVIIGSTWVFCWFLCCQLPWVWSHTCSCAKFRLLFPAAPKFALQWSNMWGRENGAAPCPAHSLCTVFHAEVSVCLRS